MTRVSVVIPSWNTRVWLGRCLSALARSGGELEIVVIDNASSDGSADLVRREFPAAALIQNARNEGFAKACNQGLAQASAPFVLFLNSDTEVASDAIERLVQFLEQHPSYAAAAPRLMNADGSTQRACMEFPGLRTPFWFATPLERWFPHSRELRRYFARDFDYEHDRDANQPPAAALLLRRATLESLGAFDESMWLFFNDVDLSLRLFLAGWRTRYLCEARVLHGGGASTRQFGAQLERWHLDRLAYFRKHHGRLSGVWVKACTTFAWIDFVWTNVWRRMLGKAEAPREKIGPTTRAFVRFLGA